MVEDLHVLISDPLMLLCVTSARDHRLGPVQFEAAAAAAATAAAAAAAAATAAV